ncbi:MAG: hypothetical protein BWY79_00597 [Actinobacteria bacterium ADurb.Bin444]|jgi:hypothetical protein|nr:MAG: hypothetical protein BWY79_00597 [Actinobacteria bacterium ADurb.Bin444]
MQFPQRLDADLKFESREQAALSRHGFRVPGQRPVAAGSATDEVEVTVFRAGVMGVGGEDGGETALVGQGE